MSNKIFINKKTLNVWVGLVFFIFLTLGLIVLLRSAKGLIILEKAFASFVLFFLVPFIFIKFFLKLKPDYFFLTIKKSKKTLEWLLALALVFIFFVWFFVLKLNGLGFAWNKESSDLVIFVSTFFLPIIVFSQEFFFRGFLLRIFWDRFSVLTAIFCQAALFTLFQLLTNIEVYNLPRLVMVFIIAVTLGFLVVRFRSVFISAIVYWFYLFLTELYIIYGLNQKFIQYLIEKNQ